MKTYDEIAKSVLQRRDAYEEAKRIKRQSVAHVSTAVVCLVVVSAIGFGIGRKNWLKTQIQELISFQATNISDENADSTSANVPTANTTTRPATTNKADTTDALTTTTSSELYYEIDWDKKSMPGKFCAVRLNHINYINISDEPGYNSFTEYVYPFGPFEETATTRNTSELISDMQLEALEPDGTLHTTTVDIFSLEGLSENLALGVRFPDDDRIFTYVSSTYVPGTLGEFLSAIDYDNTVTYGGITLYPGNNFPVNSQNTADIKKYLLSDTSLVNITDADAEATGSCVIASIYCRELGRENKVLRIWENGFITTNLIGYEFSFNVGEEAVASFLKNSYNITFEQIKELTAVTTNTTEPYTSGTDTTAEEDVTETVTTTSLPSQPTTDAVTTNAPEAVTAEGALWCGTGLEESKSETEAFSTTSETTTE